MIEKNAEILSRSTNEIIIEGLIYCADIVKDNGEVFFIKLDGEREKCHYTVRVFGSIHWSI